MTYPRLVHETATAPIAPRDRLLRLPEVLRLTGVGKSTWYALMAAGRAPRGVCVTPRCIAWSEQACLAWVHARLAEAANDNGAGQAVRHEGAHA